MTPVKKHSKLGASIAKRWLNCPASVAACEGLPNTSSKAADEGTAAHEMAELALKSGRTCSGHLVGKTAENGVVFTKEMARAVDVYVNEVWRAVVPTKDNPVAGTMAVEHKFHLGELDGELFGTNDAIVRRGDTLHVFDYKHGAGVFVDVNDNPQLKYYAVGAMLHPELGVGVSKITLTIVQPRAAGYPIRSVDIDPMDLMEFAADLKEGAAKTRMPGAPFAAGDWCRFCPKAPDCDAHRKKAFAAAVDAFSDIDAPAPKLQSPLTMTPEELTARYKLLPQLELWIKQFKAHVLASSLGGNPPIGFKLVHGRGSRKFYNPDAALGNIAVMEDLAIEQLYETKALSVAQIEALVGKDAFKNYGEYVSKTLGGPTLAPETSDKKVFESKLAGAFDDVDIADID
jgi:hypothetical protein